MESFFTNVGAFHLSFGGLLTAVDVADLPCLIMIYLVVEIGLSDRHRFIWNDVPGGCSGSRRVFICWESFVALSPSRWAFYIFLSFPRCVRLNILPPSACV